MIRILGAGIAGLAIATELEARGQEVQLVDPKGPAGPHGCSWWAGGMLAPWCEFENAEEPVLRHGQAAMDWWRARTNVTEAGSLVVASRRDLPDLKRFAARTENYDTMDADQIKALEPDLHGYSQGLYFAKEAHLDPRTALADLTHALKAKVQVAPTGSAALTINCIGFAARTELNDLRGVKGEMLVIRAPDVQITRPVRLLHPRIPLYIVPRGAGVYMLGATMIESSDKARITARSMLELLSAAYALNPAFGEAEVLEIGVDVRPAFPDNLPRIRRRGDTIFANGLYRHGYLLAPAVAAQVADLALDNIQGEFVDEYHP